MDASLRRFEQRDRDGVLALSRHALARLEEQVGAPLWANRADLDAELAAWPGDPGDLLRVAEEDGEIAGFGGLQPSGGPTVLGPLVGPQHRGRKIGSALLDEIVALAKGRGEAWLQAAVGPRNVGGRLLLERFGFRPRGGIEAVYRLLPADHRPAESPPPDTVIRPGIAEDLDRIWQLYRDAFPRGRRTSELWQQWLEQGQVMVAERGGRPVAFVRVEPGTRWITHVGVAEEERGGGLGVYLFSRAVEAFWHVHPNTDLRLSVSPDNTPAIRLYRRLGFAPWLVLQGFEREL